MTNANVTGVFVGGCYGDHEKGGGAYGKVAGRRRSRTCDIPNKEELVSRWKGVETVEKEGEKERKKKKEGKKKTVKERVR